MGSETFEGYIRVTEVLSYFAEPGLVDWMIKKGPGAKKIGKQAIKVGTEVDEAVKLFVATGKYGKVKTIEATSCLDGFKRWYDDYKPVLTVGERLFSEELKLTGEPDIYWYDEVIDIKCASSIRPKYYFQVAAYKIMNPAIVFTSILRLHKHLEDYEYKKRNELEVAKDGQGFIGLLIAYNQLTSGTAAKGEQNVDSTTSSEVGNQF